MAKRRTPEDLSQRLLELGDAVEEGVQGLLDILAPSRPRRRRDWSSLSPTQKERYKSAGRSGRLTGTSGLSTRQVRRYYESGKSLQGGRGYHPAKGAAPRKATVRASKGTASRPEELSLKEWRKVAPAWIPRDRAVMSDDTASSLSQLGTAPRNWKSVQIIPDESRKGYYMIVTTKRGAVRVTHLSDRDALSEVGKAMKGSVLDYSDPDEAKRLRREWSRKNGDPWQFDVEVYGYGNATSSTPPEVPRDVKRALPTAPPKKTTKRKRIR